VPTAVPPSGAPTAAGNGIGGCVDLSGALSGSGWEDSFGDGCLKFEGSPEWCEYYGDEDANGEGTAKQVCCVCGGGHTGPSEAPTAAPPSTAPSVGPTEADATFAPSEAPTVVPPSAAPTAVCLDLPGDSGGSWNDGDYECADYDSHKWCASYGHEMVHAQGTANDKCCTCGGGNRGPTASPTLDYSPSLPPTESPTHDASIPTKRPTPTPTVFPTRNHQPTDRPTVHQYLCPTLESSEICSGHGTCDSATGKCSCDRGFTNDYCSKAQSCKVFDCGHGSCKEQDGVAVCQCDQGYDGTDCNHKTAKSHSGDSTDTTDTTDLSDSTDDNDKPNDDDNSVDWTSVVVWITVAAVLLLIAGGVVWGYKKFRPGGYEGLQQQYDIGGMEDQQYSNL